MALAVGIGGTMSVIGFVKSESIFNEVTLIYGTGAFTAEKGEQTVAYHEEDSRVPRCAVDTPDGSGIEPELDGSFSFDKNGRSWESFDGFTAPASGEYKVDCDEDTIMIGPPVNVLGVFASVSGLLLAVFGGGFGFLLLMIGLIWFFVTRKKA